MDNTIPNPHRRHRRPVSSRGPAADAKQAPNSKQVPALRPDDDEFLPAELVAEFEPTLPAQPRIAPARMAPNMPVERDDVNLAIPPTGGEQERPILRPAVVQTTPASSQPISATGAGPMVGRYDLRDVLGRGGMGMVRLAYDHDLRREVAFKVMLGDHVDERTTACFVEEAQVTSQLEHPNIVPVHELGRDAQGRLFYTMKRVRGVSVKAKLKEAKDAVAAGRNPEEVFPLSERLDILRKILDAMGYAHDHGVIHRDLKPENIMVGRHGEVLVMDWGLARLIGAPGAADITQSVVASDRAVSGSHQTVDGTVAGTPAYMSPEQARGDIAALDARSDIFAIGCLLYEFLTLSAPYGAKTLAGTVIQAAKADYEPVLVKARHTLGRYASAIPRDLAAICEKAMQAHVRRRYQSCAEMRADIDAWATALPVSARRAGIFEQVVMWAKRHPSSSVAFSLATVFVMMVATIVAVYGAQVESNVRARLEAEASAAQARAQAATERESRVRELVEKAKWQDLAKEVGVAVKNARDAAIDELDALYRDNLVAGMKNPFGAISTERKKNCLEALNRLFRAHGVDPSLVTVTSRDYFLRGYLRYDVARDLAGALDDFSQALLLDNENCDALRMRGHIHSDEKKWDLAIVDFDRLIQLDPSDAEGYNERATVYRELGQPERAIRDLNVAIRLYPNFAGYYFNRGNSYTDMGDYALAVRDYTEAIRLDMTDPAFLSQCLSVKPHWHLTLYLKGG